MFLTLRHSKRARLSVGIVVLIWRYTHPDLFFDIDLMLVGEKSVLKVQRVVDFGTRNVDVSAREGVHSNSCNS